METSSCRFLQIALHLQNDVFSKAAFLGDLNDNINLDQEVHAWSLGSKENPDTQHAHLVVDFREENIVTVVISYHFADSDSSEVLDIREPYLEDCAQWLSRFIQTEKVIADIQVLYSFGEEYTPKITLPFPLLNVMEASDLTDAVVTGVAIRFQAPASRAERVIIEKFAKYTLMSIYSTQELALKEFAVGHELEEFTPLVNRLIRERKAI